jgi:hypothetical protein
VSESELLTDRVNDLTLRDRVRVTDRLGVAESERVKSEGE